jgi:nitrogen regulatory protein PII
MSLKDVPIQSAVLVTIIGEAVLQNQILSMLTSLGASGYTVSPTKGSGSQGSRMGDIAGYNTNVEIKTIVSQEISDEILSSLRDYQGKQAFIAFRQNVEALY